jgi:opacity protein-like surface antigen
MLAVAAFALMAPIAMAQAQLKFGIGAGASLPGGDLKDGVETGYHLMATAGVQPPLSPVGFRVDGAWNQFSEKSPGTDNLRILSLSANAIVGMPGAMVVKPYAIGGVGMYNSKNSAANSESSNDMGVNLGAGVSFGLAGFGAFAEVRWHKIFPEEVAGFKPNISYIPLTFGITF